MKQLSLLTSGICLLGLLAMPATTFAKKNKNAPEPQTAPSDVFAQYDKNTNGVLDVDEKAALLKDFAKDPKGALAVYDMNNDGKLSDDEIAAIPATKAVDAPTKKHKKKA